MKTKTIIKRLKEIRVTYNSGFFGDSRKRLGMKLGNMNTELYNLIKKLENNVNFGGRDIRRTK